MWQYLNFSGTNCTWPLDVVFIAPYKTRLKTLFKMSRKLFNHVNISDPSTAWSHRITPCGNVYSVYNTIGHKYFGTNMLVGKMAQLKYAVTLVHSSFLRAGPLQSRSGAMMVVEMASGKEEFISFCRYIDYYSFSGQGPYLFRRAHVIMHALYEHHRDPYIKFHSDSTEKLAWRCSANCAASVNGGCLASQPYQK